MMIPLDFRFPSRSFGCFAEHNKLDMMHAVDFPLPNGPMIPRTNDFDSKNPVTTGPGE
jgi:hypothetical protein